MSRHLLALAPVISSQVLKNIEVATGTLRGLEKQMKVHQLSHLVPYLLAHSEREE